MPSGPQADESEHPERLRIVVAEDEPIIRMDIVEILQGAGHEVVGQATNGLQAVELVIAAGPDVAVLDVKMPGQDGLAAAEQIADLDVPCAVVMLTAFNQQALVARAAEAGAMGYVTKPFAGPDLLAALTIAVARHAERADLAGRVDALTERLADRRVIERAKGLVQARFGIDEEAAYSLLRTAAMARRVPLRDQAAGVVAGDFSGLGD